MELCLYFSHENKKSLTKSRSLSARLSNTFSTISLTDENLKRNGSQVSAG